jgi:nucleoid-associated protein YgaU
MINVHAQFFFGLGVGLFIAGLVFIATPTTMSNSELERRARDMGMVFKEEVLLFGTEEEAKDEGSKTAEEDVQSPAQGQETEQGSDALAAEQESQEEKKPSPRSVTLTIAPGSTLNDIGEQLEALQVIKNKEDFLAEVTSQGVSNKIVADTYEIPTDSSPADVVRILTEQYRQ